MEITQRVWDGLHPAVQARVCEILGESPVGQPVALTCILLTRSSGDGAFSAAFLQLCSQQVRLFEILRPFEEVLEAHRGLALAAVAEPARGAVQMAVMMLSTAFAQPPDLIAMQHEITPLPG